MQDMTYYVTTVHGDSAQLPTYVTYLKHIEILISLTNQQKQTQSWSTQITSYRGILRLLPMDLVLY